MLVRSSFRLILLERPYQAQADENNLKSGDPTKSSETVLPFAYVASLS